MRFNFSGYFAVFKMIAKNENFQEIVEGVVLLTQIDKLIRGHGAEISQYLGIYFVWPKGGARQLLGAQDHPFPYFLEILVFAFIS